MWHLLRKKDSCTSIELTTVKERFCQQIPREFLRLKSGFFAIRVRVKCADRFFEVLVDVGIVGIFRFKSGCRRCEGVEQLCRPDKSAWYYDRPES
jgi:hypothetical protein